MTPTVIFLLLTIILLYIGYFFVLPALSHSNYSADGDQDILNTELYKNKLAELKADLDAGTIEKTEFSNAETELKLQLLSEASVNPDKVFTSPEALRYRLILLLVLAIPAVSAVLYVWLGHPGAMNQRTARSNPHGVATTTNARAGTNTSQDSITNTQISSSDIAKLEKNLQSKPNDPTVLFTLARAYQKKQQYAKAAALYKRILVRIPKTHRRGESFATFMASYADVLATSQQGVLKGEPIKLVFQALEGYPNHRMALHLAGTYYFRKKDYKGALKFWEKLYKLSANDPNYAGMLKASIDLARKKLSEANGSPSTNAVASTDSTTPKKSGTVFTITGTISIDPALKFTPSAENYLFIFAKQPNGPPRPLAAIKLNNISYPYKFTLNDSHLIIKGRRSLKDLMPLVLTARIAQTGNAFDRVGSVTGSVTVTSDAAKDIKIMINKR